MSSGSPVAIINGIGLFGARKLADVLEKKDIQVVGVESADELGVEFDYAFDFVFEEALWKKCEENGARCAIVGVNQSFGNITSLTNYNFNWRVLNFHGVFGVGLKIEKGANEEVGYLSEAIKMAVANNNLVLPSRTADLRLLSDLEITEVIMKGTFLSGTESQVFEIWGEQIRSAEIATALIDEAKMTRFKVIEGGMVGNIPDKETIEEVWQRLRWRPEFDFKEAIKEVLQEAFSRADEEKRRQIVSNDKYQISNKKMLEVEVEPEIEIEKEILKPEKPIKKFEVEVEERIELKKNQIDEKKEIDKIIEKEYKGLISEPEIEEIETELKPILVKNSNNRLVNNEQLPSQEIVHKIEPLKITVEKPIVKVEFKKRINWLKWGWGVFGGVWLVVLIMSGVFVFRNAVIYQNVMQLKQLVNDKKYDQAESVVKKTLLRVRSQESGVEDWGFNQWVWGRRYQEVLKVVEQGLLIGEKTIALSKQSESVNDAIFKDKDIDWKKEMVSIQTEVDAVGADLGMLSGRLAGDWKWLPSRWRGRFFELKTQLSEINRLVGLGGRAVAVLPELVGADGKRREYMVLFQNENEIRAGGGFIGSYGILSFEGGNLKNFEIKDVYEADGQLKGHVEPPEPIKNYLGEAKWYMRDANWQPDFNGTSKDIQWFLEKETGRKVDGIIGINLSVAKEILGVVGEVYVPDFKEKINSSNLYEQAEFYSETNSFPGSVQKASFLGGLGKQLFEEIKNLKGEKRAKLMEAMIGLMEKNELQVSLNNKEAAKVMDDLGWSGEMYSGKCGSKDCLTDYLYILESNLGVNKANYFLYRNLDMVVDIGNQTVSRVVKISYENTAKSNSWPGGEYKNYMRVYLPVTSNLAEVSVTTPAVSGSGGQTGVKTIYSGDSLRINTVKGKKEVGFLVTVPIGSKRVVELRYTDQIDLSAKTKFIYVNYIQKQSGFGDTGMVSLVTMPEGWQVNQVEPMATLVNGKLLFNQKLDRDIKMGVEIGK